MEQITVGLSQLLKSPGRSTTLKFSYSGPDSFNFNILHENDSISTSSFVPANGSPVTFDACHANQ
jgi:hypothetical protein